MPERRRTPISRSLKIEVYFRDHWLCTYCHRPTVFPPAFELLAESIASELPEVPIAIYNGLWRRDKAPLLDELAACVDHIHSYADGGTDDISNLTTCCNRCNIRKSARLVDDYLKENPPRKVRGKYGEPEDWDGLASLFVVLAREGVSELRIDYGPGRRVYFVQRGSALVILLADGDKRTQNQDVQIALELAHNV